MMEHVLGHASWYENLRAAMTALDEVDALWATTRLFDDAGRIEHIPGVPAYIRASARALVDLRRASAGWSYDVLFFNTQKPAAFCQMRMLRTPTMLMTDVTPVQYDRMASAYDHAADKRFLIRAAKHRINALNFRLAAAVIAWSGWVRGSLVDDYGVSAERVHVIPPGVDTAFWRPAEARPEHGRPRLLFVGGNFERKGGKLLLEVFRSLGLQDSAELHIVTRDPVEPSPGVVVHGELQNNSAALLRLYQDADALVLPTLADCFSIASIEAMAAGLPVITSAVGGIPDIVDDGRTGFLVPAGDGRRLGQALLTLLHDPRERVELGRKARARAVSTFSAEVSARRIVELAQELVAERAAFRKQRPLPGAGALYHRVRVR